MTQETDFTEMPVYRDPNVYRNEYKMDAESAADLRLAIQNLNDQITPLKEEAETLSGAAKGAITRKITPLMQERDVLVKLLKNNAPPAPESEADFVAYLIDTAVGIYHHKVKRLAELQLTIAACAESVNPGEMAYQIRHYAEDLFAVTEAVRFFGQWLDREHMVNFTTVAQLHTHFVNCYDAATEEAHRFYGSRSTSQMSNLEDDAKHAFYCELVGRDRLGGIRRLLSEIDWKWDRVVSYRLANPATVTQLSKAGEAERRYSAIEVY